MLTSSLAVATVAASMARHYPRNPLALSRQSLCPEFLVIAKLDVEGAELQVLEACASYDSRNSAGTSRHYGVGPLAFASTLDALREGGTRLHLDVKVGAVKSWASRAALLEPGFDALSVSITDG